MILVTSGCSFSRPGVDGWPHTYTWSNYLEQKINPSTTIHTGLSCQGNDMISRKVIYNVTKLLEHNDSKDIVVCIMWSGVDRHSLYSSTEMSEFVNLFPEQENPTSVVPDEKKWYILNSADPTVSKIFYSTFYDYTESAVKSCEHILRTQWFLEKHNIRYVMSTYMSTVLPKKFLEISEVAYLYKQINFDYFLKIDGELEWCKEYSGLPFNGDDLHPTHLQHEAFTDRIIIPFLKENKYI